MQCGRCGWHRRTGRAAVKIVTQDDFSDLNTTTIRNSSWREALVVFASVVSLVAGFCWFLAHRENALVYQNLAIGFCILVGILTCVTSFRDGLRTGLAVTLIPFYVLYYVYFRSENRLIKQLTTVSILSACLAAATRAITEQTR